MSLVVEISVDQARFVRNERSDGHDRNQASHESIQFFFPICQQPNKGEIAMSDVSTNTVAPDNVIPFVSGDEVEDYVASIRRALEEIVNPLQRYAEGLKEISFLPERFRPLVSKSAEAGMNVLRKLLQENRLVKMPRARAATLS
jgi:hypothetical protein